MAIYNYETTDYYVVDTLKDIMELSSRNGIYIQISKRYLEKDDHAFIYKGWEEYEK